MRIRITRTWEVAGFPSARLRAGDMLEMPARVAVYFFAMGCAVRDDGLESRSPTVTHDELGAGL